MIAILWSTYLGFVFIQVIMALNFLIAIVSQSYESIMDRQLEAIVESHCDLNLQCMQELNPRSEEEILYIVLRTTIGVGADGSWNGVTQTVKKDLRKIEDLIRENKKEMRKIEANQVKQEKEAEEMRNMVQAILNEIKEIKKEK